MNGKSNNDGIWVLVVCCILTAWWGSTRDRFKISPLAKHGRDTILYKDTAYIIKFKIDTAIYVDPNPDGETPERP